MAPPASSASNIRVSVHFAEPVVFAGETVECTIRFRNVAPVPGQRRSSAGLAHQPAPRSSPIPSAPLHQNGGAIAPGAAAAGNADRQRQTPPSLSRNSSFTSHAPSHHPPVTATTATPRPPQERPAGRGHRPALSLNTPANFTSHPRSPIPNSGVGSSGSAGAASAKGHRHGRSLSIMSLGADTPRDDGASQGRGSAGGIGSGRRQGKPGHGRSASLQVVPRKGSSPFPASGSPGQRSVTQPSPLHGSNTPIPTTAVQAPEFQLPARPNRRPSAMSVTAPSTPGVEGVPSRKPSGSISQNFKFPASAPSPSRSPGPGQSAVDSGPAVGPRPHPSQLRSHSPRPPESGQGVPGLGISDAGLSPLTRIISGSSMNGTPRSSGEFYSMSNNSSETLASEYAPQTARPSSGITPGGPRSVLLQNTPQLLKPPKQWSEPESLMMGYVQLMGSFMLDGSLVNQAPFEEVKRKGVVGGQGGGGVVGVERPVKRDSGLFGALGWSNIGESLGGLLGNGEPSSIREMRGIANSKAIPLISTPQSILFVDLTLAPGESRSFRYSFKLPRGLPPTHKGRVMKVNYNLSIGTQRPGVASKDRLVKHVEVPFRVFGSVNMRGEILGHDLMTPYIILRDSAQVTTVLNNSLQPASNGTATPSNPTTSLSEKRQQEADADAAVRDFHTYIDALLAKPDDQYASTGLLSPTMPVTPSSLGRRHSSIAEETLPETMKAAIDLAILRSNQTASTYASNGDGRPAEAPNRFEIARSGRRVAVLTLTRPAYRLGETVTATLDFAGARLRTFGVAALLESAERVDPAIALRSPQSVLRASRKVHASAAEATVCARRVSVALSVPGVGASAAGGGGVAGATPEFITSGISLEWKLRVEFTTQRLAHVEAAAAAAAVEEDEEGSEGAEAGAGVDEEEDDALVGRKAKGKIDVQRARQRLPLESLLEEVGSDDRGVILAAVERLPCETFEVAVPIRIYGAVLGGGEGVDVEDLPV
ncbi:Rgp1-domain-containing protein [Lineolata rhizophorae]|uniref:Rgp1-domain-containing protein n=1 Tax=Lineolata rhizophorae TaxID=578093 RepID=A0A6A6P8A8_9PEZI|nr:Rgp1-domain-containing protein [Lineolata rhizophorae]